MDLLQIVAVAVYTFGIYAFGSILALEVRSYRRPSAHCACRGGWDPVGWALLVVSFLWFGVGLGLVLASEVPLLPGRLLQSASLFLLHLFPPLVVHATYAELRRVGSPLRHPLWRLGLGAIWLASQATVAWLLAGYWSLLPVSERLLNAALGISVSVLFGYTGVYCMLALSRGGRRPESRAERSSRRWMFGMFTVMVLLTVSMLFAWSAAGQVLSFLGSCLPLMFFFVAFYHEDRFEFFDLFIKRGAFLLSTMLLLVGCFAVVGPLLEPLELGAGRPWVAAVLVLPVAMALPWLHRRLGGFLDNVWLGRRFAPVQAVKHFLGELRDATSEQELVAAAERGLSTIFQAQVRVDLGLGPAAPPQFASAHDVPIVAHGVRAGTVRLGHRTNDAPYFSEDRNLLDSLCEVLSSMLENVRLQERKQLHEQQARELSLHASRSELKALRAQVNPHFLFNALNAIAGLIHKDPLKADRTVEQLAEVFRYTLRGSQQEWAVLDDEMEFVRAYLDVEQARFGQRLEVQIDVEESARPLRILTMMVQTLVENAVKHGIASVRDRARIRVRARRDGERLRIEVADNGPGFDAGLIDGGEAAPGSSGFGLQSIRKRIHGYFGEDAELTVRRDAEQGLTVVAVCLPVRDAHRGASRDATGSTGVA